MAWAGRRGFGGPTSWAHFAAVCKAKYEKTAWKRSRKKFNSARPARLQKYRAEMRGSPTNQEQIMRGVLRDLGLQFECQKIILDRFIADFYLWKSRIVIECDGSIHLKPEQRQYDEWRNREMIQASHRVLRFNSDDFTDVMTIKRRILDEILKAQGDCMPSERSS